MSFEVPHSPGLLISHSAAAAETAGRNQENITPDLSICGITKLEALQSSAVLHQIGLSPQMIPAFIAEVQQLLQLLREAGIVPRDLRYALRERVGDGGYQRAEGEHISRTDEVKIAFNRASEIAAENEAQIVMVHHLLAALLEIPDTHTREWLAENAIDVDALIEGASKLPMPKIERQHVMPDGDILAELGTDLTEKARRGDIGRIIKRKGLETQVIQSLMRQKKNAPLLVGKPGIGKTAIVEALALRIANGNLNQNLAGLKSKRIIQIEVSSLIEGTTYRGDLEKRVRTLIQAASSDRDVILFIDEIHQLMGAGGGGQNAMDVANMFKTALGRGEFAVIGATTDDEYRQYIEKDAAMERRFERIVVEEPAPQEALEILVGLRPDFEAHDHPVTIDDDALTEAVNLSIRYIKDRYLPDKAIDIIDRACASTRTGGNISRSPLGNNFDGDLGTDRVTVDVVRATVAEMTGIAGITDDVDIRERVARLGAELNRWVVGQEGAIASVVNPIQSYYAGFHDGNSPIAVLLFAGPTGVGKTEVARKLAHILFDSERAMLRIDMSEYMEKHNVARLIGAPPGYTGHDEGGQLTNILKRQPYCVVLLDEVEKAHPDVLNIFLQVFDDGRLTDGQGDTVDATNVIFIMTSNLGYTEAGVMPAREAVQSAIYSHLRPEFIGRVDEIVYFLPLEEKHISAIVVLLLENFRQQLPAKLDKSELHITPEAQTWLAQHGYDPRSGARAVLNLFKRKVKSPLSRLINSGAIQNGEHVLICVENDDIVVKRETPPTI